jgi:hypothetical protein
MNKFLTIFLFAAFLSGIAPENEDRFLRIITLHLSNSVGLKIVIVKCFSSKMWNMIRFMKTEEFEKMLNELSMKHQDEFHVWELDFQSNWKRNYLILHDNYNYYGIVIFIKFLDAESKTLIIPAKNLFSQLFIGGNEVKLTEIKYDSEFGQAEQLNHNEKGMIEAP